MQNISDLIIPIMVLGIVLYGIIKKINVYDVFVDGAQESYDMIIIRLGLLLITSFIKELIFL